MAIKHDAKFVQFPGRNTPPLLDFPFGNASPGCFIFARNPEGLALDFPVDIGDPNDLPPASTAYRIDNFQWALGDTTTPLILKRYSQLHEFQLRLGEEIQRGDHEHLAILSALRHQDLRVTPSRIGIEATVLFREGETDYFVVGNHTDLKINPTRSPIPHAGFAPKRTPEEGETVQDLIEDAVVDMCINQLGLQHPLVEGNIVIHTIYTLGRRLQTQIAVTVDLRDQDVTRATIEFGHRDALEGPQNPSSRHSGIEILTWDEDTIERFAGSHSWRSTKQNLSSVFLAAASDGIISEEAASQYVGARSATTELILAGNTHINTLLDNYVPDAGSSVIGPRAISD